MKDRDLIDKTFKAARRGLTFTAAFADDHHGEVKNEGPKPGGIVAEFTGTLLRGLRDGTIPLCEHIKMSEPEPMYWVPYRPARMNCGLCHDAIELEIRATPEDATCDKCGAYVPGRIHGTASHITAAIYPQFGVAFGPITIHFGLCDTCDAKERSL